MKKIPHISIKILIALSIFILGFSVFLNRASISEVIPNLVLTSQINSNQLLPKESRYKKNSETIDLTAGEIHANLPIQGSTLYQVLLAGQKSGLISFLGKNYSGLGFFITDIGTLHSGGGKYLIYYINGKEAPSGVSSYIPKDGDIISWELK